MASVSQRCGCCWCRLWTKCAAARGSHSIVAITADTQIFKLLHFNQIIGYLSVILLIYFHISPFPLPSLFLSLVFSLSLTGSWLYPALASFALGQNVLNGCTSPYYGLFCTFAHRSTIRVGCAQASRAGARIIFN